MGYYKELYSQYGKKITTGICKNCKYKAVCGTPNRQYECKGKEVLKKSKKYNG